MDVFFLLIKKNYHTSYNVHVYRHTSATVHSIFKFCEEKVDLCIAGLVQVFICGSLSHNSENKTHKSAERKKILIKTQFNV